MRILKNFRMVSQMERFASNPNLLIFYTRVTGKDSQSNPAKFILWVSRISTAPAICPNLSFPDDVLRGAEASKARIFESLKFGVNRVIITMMSFKKHAVFVPKTEYLHQFFVRDLSQINQNLEAIAPRMSPGLDAFCGLFEQTRSTLLNICVVKRLI
ncbi:hypothetical protein LENED_012447 [Lentinula edodes]|uniref:Uncharacterized protein n=1 Tax=Lentinula edodes TaxID=5353 RepID=A0A1Q3ESM6_LENED|nr:hypothetical protein LENED_012447 [Lentinula edodes]